LNCWIQNDRFVIVVYTSRYGLWQFYLTFDRLARVTVGNHDAQIWRRFSFATDAKIADVA
jgi:hypothetical protein